MTRSTDITSFTDVRQNLRRHLQRVKRTGRPLYITTNGETDAVVLSPRAFDALIEQAELAKSLAMLDRSMEDVVAGRVRPMKTAVRDIAKDLGLRLDR